MPIIPAPHAKPRPRNGRPALHRVAAQASIAAPWIGLVVMSALWIRAHRRRMPGLSRQDVGTPETFDRKEPGRGRAATLPHRIPLTGWKDIVWRVYREIGHDRLPVIAGGVTFHILLAIVPAVGVFVSLYGLFADVSVVNRQLGQLAAFVPPEVLAIVGDQMMRLASQRPGELSVAFIVSLLLSLWTASLGVRVIIDALNVAYEEVERRHIVLRFALTYVLTLAALLFFAIVTALLVATPLVLTWLGVGRLLIPFRWLVVFLIVAGSFAILYRYGPSRTPPKWPWVIWGAVLASVAWMGGSLGYSWYVNNVARFEITYGSLGALVGFLFWIWFSVMALLVGAELNAEIEHQTAVDTTEGEPKPMGERGAVVADTVGLAFIGFRRGAARIWRAGQRQVGSLFRRIRSGASPTLS